MADANPSTPTKVPTSSPSSFSKIFLLIAVVVVAACAVTGGILIHKKNDNSTTAPSNSFNVTVDNNSSSSNDKAATDNLRGNSSDPTKGNDEKEPADTAENNNNANKTAEEDDVEAPTGSNNLDVGDEVDKVMSSFLNTTGVVNCTYIYYSDDMNSAEVCYTASATGMSGISQEMLPNGTMVTGPASASSTYMFDIWKKRYDGENITDMDETTMIEAYTGTSIVVSYGGLVYYNTTPPDDQQECESVIVSGKECNSCSFCGNDKTNITADCTNVPNGRYVECELLDPVFYPLTFNAVVPSAENCTMMNDGLSDFEICYTPAMAAISGIGFFPNGTETPASQVYWYNYTVYDNDNDDVPVFLIEVERSGDVLDGGSGQDLTKCSYVKVDGEDCSSCFYCGNETFSADCTNIAFGRVLECESTRPVFFPLTAEALEPNKN